MHLKQDAEGFSIANLLISFLVRFPAIFTLNYNIAAAEFSFSFLLTKNLERENYFNFKAKLFEHLEAYREILNLETSYPKIKQSFIDSWTLLEITWKKENILLEEINLVNSVILNEFKTNVIIDLRQESPFSDGGGMMPDDDFTKYLLSRKEENKEENLFAFREAGKVYIFDK